MRAARAGWQAKAPMAETMKAKGLVLKTCFLKKL